MTRLQNAECLPQNNFTSAEHLWFWFVSSTNIKTVFRTSGGSGGRPCELLDVETLITRMYLSGKLTVEQLDVMKKYGDMRRAPNQHIFRENREAALWNSAMKLLEYESRKKGWIF